MTDLTMEQIRQEFPGLYHKVYFNFGGQGILPRSAMDAIIDTYQYIEKVGPFGLKINAWLQKKTAETKAMIASELGVTPHTISLTENVTASCNIALWGLDWKPGDQILLTDAEHPGVIATVQEISRRFGVEIVTCPILETLNQGDPVMVIREYLTPNTQLFVMSHVLWNSGQVLPLKEIVETCHNYNQNQPVKVLVDGAQSVGMLPLNLKESGVDFYAFTGHKWLCGPSGVGGLYINPEVFTELKPTFIGWRGVNPHSPGEVISFKDDGSKFEVATSAYPLYQGLSSGISTHRQWGSPQKRYERICNLSAYLWEKLQSIEGIKTLKNSPPESGLVSFYVNQKLSPDELVKELEKRGFFLRTLADPYCVRACVHYFTLESEIDELVNTIKDILNLTP
jgi:L-cysteine/cystine lyase